MSEVRHAELGQRSIHRRIWAISVFLAVVVWYWIRAAISFDTFVTDVPILILHDEGWAVLDRSDETAEIRFRGSRGDVRDINRDQVQVVLDVRGQSAGGQRTVRIDASRVRAPAGVKAVYIRPESVLFSLDREAERQVPVKADLQGSIPEGYAVLQAICTPASVLLRGPMTRLEAVDVIRTAAVDLDGRVQSFRVRRPLLPPPGLTAARIDPDRVHVDVQVIEHSSIHTLERVPIGLLSDPDRPLPILEGPFEATVVLQGRAEVLRSLDASSIRVFIDTSRIRETGLMELPVDWKAPLGLRVTGVTPSSARVRIPSEKP